MKKPGVFTSVAFAAAATFLPACSSSPAESPHFADPADHATVDIDCAGAKIKIDFGGIRSVTTPATGGFKSGVSHAKKQGDSTFSRDDQAVVRFPHPRVLESYVELGVDVHTTDFQDEIDEEYNSGTIRAGIVSITREQYNAPLARKDAKDTFAPYDQYAFVMDEFQEDNFPSLVEHRGDDWTREHTTNEPVTLSFQPIVGVTDVPTIDCTISKTLVRE